MAMITIELAEGDAEAYACRPASGVSGPVPGVLLFMDLLGLRPRIEEMAQRIADWGYVVLAPNTLYRSGTAADTSPTRDLREPGVREEHITRARPWGAEMTTLAMAADVPLALAALRGLDGVADGPVGVTGYCMGARWSMVAAAIDPGIAAAAGWHGARLATDAPDSPHRMLGAARAEFAFGHADQDASMPPESVEELGRALADAGLEFANEVYAGAAHGYTMSDTTVYDEAATERHFAALEDLFARRLR